MAGPSERGKKTRSADPAMPIGRKRYSLVIVFSVSATFVLRVNIKDDGIDTRLTRCRACAFAHFHCKKEARNPQNSVSREIWQDGVDKCFVYEA